MGYSSTALASNACKSIIKILQTACNDFSSSNVWYAKGNKYFYEIGREQRDGAVTGTVWKFLTDETNRCSRAGTIRIEPDGTITRFPSTTKAQREHAEALAKVEHIRQHPNAGRMTFTAIA